MRRRTRMNDDIKKCCICGCEFAGWGNNPWPVKEDGECCDECNTFKVIPARLRQMYLSTTRKETN